jgi:hypothetical protein
METLTLPDLWNPDQLRLPPEMVEELTRRKRPPCHKSDDPFIKGPIPYTWISTACRLPGVGLHVAMAFWFLSCRFRQQNRWGIEAHARGLRVSMRSVQRALHAAELAGLLTVVRQPGHKVEVTVQEVQKSPSGKVCRPLYGPIPWTWWLPASRLSGKALQVASVCWLLGGWERSAEFKLVLSTWAEFGLTRQSCARGLDALEQANLVSQIRQQGRSAIVTLRHVGNDWPSQDPAAVLAAQGEP